MNPLPRFNDITIVFLTIENLYRRILSRLSYRCRIPRTFAEYSECRPVQNIVWPHKKTSLITKLHLGRMRLVLCHITFVMNNIGNSIWHTTDNIINNRLLCICPCIKFGVLQIRNRCVSGYISVHFVYMKAPQVLYRIGIWKTTRLLQKLNSVEVKPIGSSPWYMNGCIVLLENKVVSTKSSEIWHEVISEQFLVAFAVHSTRKELPGNKILSRKRSPSHETSTSKPGPGE